ncbi:hypothetical protein NDU88_004796 [Pleurodeles waltl]|uniref:Uncharacterized protein n=1 Tax=Pleurodeles waltl TaxID=8319 RepID=A0AAV7NNP6_PLEWA|nr:hypothetical protein NDU88_004796 [Pleurodeles waltl]
MLGSAPLVVLVLVGQGVPFTAVFTRTCGNPLVLKCACDAWLCPPGSVGSCGTGSPLYNSLYPRCGNPLVLKCTRNAWLCPPGGVDGETEREGIHSAGEDEDPTGERSWRNTSKKKKKQTCQNTGKKMEFRSP